MTKQEYLSKPYSNEDQFTANSFMYINNNFPALRGYFFHIPNESQYDQHRKKGVFGGGDLHRIKLAAMGVMPGVPDFCFLLPTLWFMELKMPDNVLSERQLLVHARLKWLKIRVFTAWNPSEVCSILEKVMQGYPGNGGVFVQQ